MSALLIHGDCLDVLPTLDACSVDAVVTDPPYDLTAGKKGGTGVGSVDLDSPYGRSRISAGNGGFMGKDWDATGVAFDPATWALVLAVMKPGAYLLAFGGTRTYHRLACAVEDAGFEIRDSISWLYGSGFPKSLDVSKAIDRAAGAEREVFVGGSDGAIRKPRAMAPGGAAREAVQTLSDPATDAARQWQGWGTALKPAHEPIVVARKPLAGTVAANVLEHGTGALNIDACRVRRAEGDRTEYGRGTELPHANTTASLGTFAKVTPYTPDDAGRWPANVVLDESQAAELDRQSGNVPSGIAVTRNGGGRKIFNQPNDGQPVPDSGYRDSGGASRFFPTFRYEAKAPTAERPRGDDGTAHPTVKPLDLMRWLVRLVTPPGGTVLDPFLGSGATAEACLIEGFDCTGIEREAAYFELANKRIGKPISAVLDMELPA